MSLKPKAEALFTFRFKLIAILITKKQIKNL